MSNAEAPPPVLAPIEAYFKGLNAHDLEAVVQAFTEGAVLVANEAESATGLASIRAAYAERFTRFDYGRELHVDDWFAEGNTAVVQCHTTGSLTLRANQTKIDAVSRELFVLQRVEGNWKIRSYMFNRVAPA